MGLYVACQDTLAFGKKKTLLGKHLNLATYQKCDEFHDSTITLNRLQEVGYGESPQSS
jgi:hypothetical protein